MKLIEKLFTEKYKPRKLEDLIIPERIRERFSKGVQQHSLFYGSPGIGKTSLAKVLVEEYNHEYLYINASRETSVDIIRNQIVNFCSVRSIIEESSKYKIVIIDEGDGASEQFYKALRATMEQFEANTRFILTCNYINKIPEPLQSRFGGGMINFDFNKEDEIEIKKGCIKRIYEISKKENLEINKDALLELVNRQFPDIRKMISTLQAYKLDGKEIVTIDDVKKFNSIYKDIYELIFNNLDPLKNYQYLKSNYSNRVDEVLSSLSVEFIDYLKQEKPTYLHVIPQIIIKVTEYQAMRTQVIDPELTMLACVYSLQEIIKEA
jgi:DNA polymerase III delta prime subunit